MEPKALFQQALQLATIEINKVQTDDFTKATPDTEWTVADLVNHMLHELSWTSDLVQSKTMAEVGDAHEGDLIGKLTLQEAWRQAAEAALTAIEQADLGGTAHLSYGDVTVAAYVQEAASDQLIHGWDLGRALGDTVQFDPAVAQEVYDRTVSKAAAMRASGLFAEPLEVADDADMQTKLLALYGRDATW